MLATLNPPHRSARECLLDEYRYTDASRIAQPMTLDPKWSIPHSLGFSVFPLKPARKTPLGRWKSFQTVRATLPVIEQWAHNPAVNVGIALGALSGVIGLDLDSDDAIMRAHIRGLPDTLTVRSPRGLHLYYRHPGGRIGNTVEIEPGIDLRGDGGFLVAPGSYYHPTDEEAADGKVPGVYTWLNPTTPIADAPEWIYAGHKHEIIERTVTIATAYRGPNEYGDAALDRELLALHNAGHGGRNDQINRSAFALGQLVAGGFLPEHETHEALQEAVHDIGDNPEKDTATMERGWADGFKQPRVILTPDQVFGTTAPTLPNGVEPVRPSDAPRYVSVGPAQRKTVLSVSELPTYFNGVVYVSMRDEFFLPEGIFLKKQPFDATYSGPKFYIGAAGQEPTKSPAEAFLRNDEWVAPRAHRTCFRPELATGSLFSEEGFVMLNCYVPVDVRRVRGDASPFVNHIRRMLPNGQDADYLLHYMASCVQNIGTKMQWWPVLQGTKGNGKTMVLDVMTYAIGRRYCHLVNPEAMLATGNQFNGWIENRLFLGFEEIWTGTRHSMIEMLKSTVTNLKIVSESKGRMQETVDNRANGILLTNHTDGVPVDDDERRFGIFWCAQQTAADLNRDGMAGSYFPDLWKWLTDDGFAIMADFLAHMPLSADMDPAQGLHRAPITSSTQAAIHASLGTVEQEVLEAVGEGRKGFCGGFISSIALDMLLKERRSRVTRNQVRPMLKRLGYEPHPALPDGRVNNAVQQPVPGKPRLYVKNASAASLLTEPSEISRVYDSAQQTEMLPAIDNVTPIRRVLP